MEFQKILPNLDLNNVTNTGLYNGQMGLCICHFVLFKITEDPKYKKQAKKILTAIQEAIPMVDDFSFGNGLSGIGWGVEWLSRNNFVDANTDAILEDLDDTLYQSVVYSRDIEHSLANGSIGKAMYFLYRYLAQNRKRSRYKIICIVECLVLLSDEISENLLNEDVGLLNQHSGEIKDQQLKEIAQALIFMLHLNERKINTQVSYETLKEIILFFEKYVINAFNIEVDASNVGFLYLTYSYFLAQKFLKKENFTQDSLFVKSKLNALKHSTEETINLIVKNKIAPPSPKSNKEAGENMLIHMLAAINLSNSTKYGYEAFMLDGKTEI